MNTTYRSQGRISAEQAKAILAAAICVLGGGRIQTVICNDGAAAELIALPEGDYQFRVAEAQQVAE